MIFESLSELYQETDCPFGDSLMVMGEGFSQVGDPADDIGDGVVGDGGVGVDGDDSGEDCADGGGDNIFTIRRSFSIVKNIIPDVSQKI